MKRNVLALLCAAVFLGGCGYATRIVPASLAGMKTIYVEPFKNSVDYETEKGGKNLYVPMMEVKVTNATVNRFVTDGFLKIAKPQDADLCLKGELIDYQRDVLRYDDNDDVQEYRITVIVKLTLLNTRTNEALWVEPAFAGDATYFPTGSNATSESAAINKAVQDLAQRIIERTVEDW